MYCRNCGEEMPDRALVCGRCGTPVPDAERIREEEIRAAAGAGEPKAPETGERRNYGQTAGGGEQNKPEDLRAWNYGQTAVPGEQEAPGTRTEHGDERAAGEAGQYREEPDRGNTRNAGRTDCREYNRGRSTYAGGTRPAAAAFDDRPAKEGRNPYIKTGLLMLFLCIPAFMAPVLMIPLGIAAVCFGVMGLRATGENTAWVIIVLGVAEILLGMVLTITAAMILPYANELVDVFTGMKY